MKLVNLMRAQKAVQDISLLWLGSLLGSGSIFLINILVARHLGVAEYGIFSSVYAMSTLFSILASFGIAQFWLKVFGREGDEALRWIIPSLKCQGVALFLSLGVMWLWAALGPHDVATRSLFFLMSAFVAGQISVELVVAKLQLEGRYSTLAVWQFLPNLMRLLVLVAFFLVCNNGVTLSGIGLIYAVTSILILGIGTYQLNNLLNGKFSLNNQITREVETESVCPSMLNVAMEAWPFGVSAVFAFIYLQIDIVMIKYISGDIEAGFYNVAYIIITASMIFPNVVYQKFFLPKYHFWAVHDRDKLYEAYKLGAVTMFLLGGAITLGIVSFSWLFVPALFGDEYRPSVPLLQVLSLGVPIYFVSYNSGATLVTKTHIKSKVLLMGIVAVMNVILNAILIPHFGAFGAACATLVSYFSLAMLYRREANAKVFHEENGVGK